MICVEMTLKSSLGGEDVFWIARLGSDAVEELLDAGLFASFCLRVAEEVYGRRLNDVEHVATLLLLLFRVVWHSWQKAVWSDFIGSGRTGGSRV